MKFEYYDPVTNKSITTEDPKIILDFYIQMYRDGIIEDLKSTLGDSEDFRTIIAEINKVSNDLTAWKEEELYDFISTLDIDMEHEKPSIIMLIKTVYNKDQLEKMESVCEGFLNWLNK